MLLQRLMIRVLRLVFHHWHRGAHLLPLFRQFVSYHAFDRRDSVELLSRFDLHLWLNLPALLRWGGRGVLLVRKPCHLFKLDRLDTVVGLYIGL